MRKTKDDWLNRGRAESATAIKIVARFIAAIVVTLVSAITAAGQTPAAAERTRAVIAAVDAAHSAGNFDGVVIVAQDGKPLVQHAVGFADRAQSHPMKPATVFRLASLTKQVTALLVMQEVAAGHLRLDETAGEAMKSLPAASGRVTLRELLQHQSGLANPSDGPDNVVPPFYTRAAADSRADAMGVCSAAPKRAPGGQFEYNNCDYIVLGAVLETVTGKPFAALLRERITAPLKLTSWGIFPAATNGPVAIGYGKDGSVELPQNPATYGAAGALFGNALDVARWDDALMRHTLLPAAETDIMFKADPKLYGEALGSWAYDSPVATPPVHVVERQGEIGGTRLLNLLLPQTGTAIVLIANTEAADLFNTYMKQGLSYAVLRAWAGSDAARALP